ncbi:glycosyltransferase family 1 protein [Auricularia subglabra TFB-10046 SS5]|nr:glycosyltransferase family 1 protein [Auricularia subglabra TFB-10046 SS5]
MSSRPKATGKTAFVTVGATSPFDALLSGVLEDDSILTLRAKGFTRLQVQCGKTLLPVLSTVRHGVDIIMWDFKPSLADDFRQADLVIGHAGSGTIVDVLRMGKPMIVVPNPSLLHNHQEELAQALQERGHLVSCAVKDLARAIRDFDFATVVPFPAFNGSKFQAILDEEMGFL